MKAIKMFGLAALTALMAMAFVGTGSAMAERTALCATDTEPCVPLTHVHETSVGKAKLLSSFGTTECEVLALGDVKSAGNPLVLEVKLTYSNCKLGGTSCTATEENGPAEVKVLKEGHETSKVTGEGLVKLVCGESLSCSYIGTGVAGIGKGPLLSTQAKGEVTVSEASLTKEAGGFLCPKTTKLDITTTPLNATYIVGGLHYCVKYQHSTNGFYSNSECTNKPAEGGPYDLVIAEAGLEVGQLLCVLLVSGGLFLERVSSTECKTDNEFFLNRWPYEMGDITMVK